MKSSTDVSFYIQQQTTWSYLPNSIRSRFSNDPNEYSKNILNYSLQNQLRFRNNLISKVFKNERRYYEKLMSFSRDNVFLYPYHLQDIIVSGLRVTPFMYYIDMLCHIISEERSYDFIPNFTAADCLRLLGIGRNQYIELMNNLRSLYPSTSNSGAATAVVNAGRRFLGLSTSNPKKELSDKIRTLLPQRPIDTIVIEPWWLVSIGIVVESDIEICSTKLRETIDFVIDKGPVFSGMLDRDELKYLYQRGMVYLDVPIEPQSIISVPTLEGFVMNRTTGDYFEILLYKIFVSIDENSTVEGLSQILEIPLSLVQQAVSVFCRLQFAHKKLGSQILQNFIQHKSWQGFISPTLRNVNETNNSESNGNNHLNSQSSNDLSQFMLEEQDDETLGMMMGITNSNSLLQISASMFMSPSPSMEPNELYSNNNGKFEDISSNIVANSPKKIAFIFDSSLTAYLMMGNLSVGLKNHAVTMFEVGKLSEESLDNFLTELDGISDVGEGEAQRYYEHAVNLRHTIRKLRNINSSGISLDLLRCGSLFSLDSASRSRMLRRNYMCLISMAPINFLNSTETNLQAAVGTNNPAFSAGNSSILSRSEMALNTNPELPHFGPIIPEITSVWFRLFLYKSTKSGPPTLLLTSGYRLRKLPNEFNRFSKLLLTPWQQESIVVPLNCALITINEALSHGPLLVQGYDFFTDSNNSLEEIHLVFPISEEKIIKYSKAVRDLVEKLESVVNLSSNCGYFSYLESKQQGENSSNIMLLQLHFGVPLFDYDLNKFVLDELEKIKIFQKDPYSSNSSNDEFHRTYQFSTRKLTIRLLEFIEQFGGWNSMGGSSSNSHDDQQQKYSTDNDIFSDIALPTRSLFFRNGVLEYFL